MLPEDMQDLIFAVIALVVLAIVTPFLGFASPFYASEIPEFSNEGQLFLINYLKTETGNGQISDLIALNENTLEEVSMPLSRLTRSLTSFYGLGGIGGRNYLITATYPNEMREVIGATNAWDISQPNHVKTTEGQKIRVEIPSLNQGLIVVELEVENE